MHRFMNWLALTLLIALVLGFFLAPDGPLETGLKKAGLFWWVVGLPWIAPAAMFVVAYRADKKRQRQWAEKARKLGIPIRRDPYHRDQGNK